MPSAPALLGLSRAIAETISRGVHPAEVEALINALPATAWRPDLGEPSVLSAMIAWNPSVLAPDSASGVRFLDALDDHDQHIWAALVDRCLTHPGVLGRIPSETAERWLNQSFSTMRNPALIKVLWDRLHEKIEPHQISTTWLVRALSESSLSEVADALSERGVSRDLADVASNVNPFNEMLSVDRFERLLAAGFDPHQQDLNGYTAFDYVKNRLQQIGWVVRTDSEMEQNKAVMARLISLALQTPETARDLFERALLEETWSDARDLLDVSFDWAGLRWPHGETILHQLALTRPEWIPDALRTPPFKKLPDTFWAIPDHDGIPALWYLLVEHKNRHLVSPMRPSVKMIQRLTCPAVDVWLAHTPKLEHSKQGWMFALTLSHRLNAEILWKDDVSYFLASQNLGHASLVEAAEDAEERRCDTVFQQKIDDWVWHQDDSGPEASQRSSSRRARQIMRALCLDDQACGETSWAKGYWALGSMMDHPKFSFISPEGMAASERVQRLRRVLTGSRAANLEWVESHLKLLLPDGWDRAFVQDDWPALRAEIEQAMLQKHTRQMAHQGESATSQAIHKKRL